MGCKVIHEQKMAGRVLRAAFAREKEGRVGRGANKENKEGDGKQAEIFLKWLPLDADEDAVREFIREKLPEEVTIENIKMLRDQWDQSFKGVAFLRASSAEMIAPRIADALDGKEFWGRNVEASVAVAKKKR